ncbi:MAG: D-glycero-alpha-D-manno-heptose-1,7-bisphosphate 7-phosphatase [Thermomicrobiales bacterium]
MATPAIFLDRDGVINENRPDHVKGWDEFRFVPGVLDALRALTRFNLPIVVVTNQAAIGRRLVARETVEAIHRQMLQVVRQAGGEITDIVYCPHRPDERCGCRKPAPGLLFEAATRLGIALDRSVFVGDAVSDILAGQRARCQTVLVLTGRGSDALPAVRASAAAPSAIVSDLSAAVPLIAHLLQHAAPRPLGNTTSTEIVTANSHREEGLTYATGEGAPADLAVAPATAYAP